MDGRSQTGIFGCVSVDDYDNDVILKHELTRPVKEDDRTRHIVEQNAHAEPIMLTFKDDPVVADIIETTISEGALYDLTASDGVQHTIWKVQDTLALVNAFKAVANLYVADGHHRCKAASRAAEQLKNTVSDEVHFFPAVLFPMGDMSILSYNRIIRRLPGTAASFLAGLQNRFKIHEVDNPVPQKKGDICLYLEGKWYGLALPESADTDVVGSLDVGLLTSAILDPMLNITDPPPRPEYRFCRRNTRNPRA